MVIRKSKKALKLRKSKTGKKGEGKKLVKSNSGKGKKLRKSKTGKGGKGSSNILPSYNNLHGPSNIPPSYNTLLENSCDKCKRIIEPSKYIWKLNKNKLCLACLKESIPGIGKISKARENGWKQVLVPFSPINLGDCSICSEDVLADKTGSYWTFKDKLVCLKCYKEKYKLEVPNSNNNNGSQLYFKGWRKKKLNN
jgi:formylmethanofuran dehydrogenase subunit E